ncbi:hypothetical protein RhiirC2_786898 [Rhizophagus irregularis]|uniref:Uncharacterized protein n=1 Tax=Rhizophagus irregularis TaxID=588596 RepID=A0A2N1MTC9_9GLOM|nr:hypothetical protein RhiirC2_786898 [Rhizophagus irregularis]
MFKDQVTNNDGSFLETWSNGKNKPTNNFKGCTLSWFHKLETDSTLSDFNRRLVNPLLASFTSTISYHILKNSRPSNKLNEAHLISITYD